MNSGPSYTFFPLGDSAITLDFGNMIDESVNGKIIALFNHLQKNPFTGMIEALPAFSSLTIYYDVALVRKMPKEKSAYESVKQKLEDALSNNFETSDIPSRLIRIPTCYEKEFGPDLATISAAKKLTVDEIIRLHTTKKYRVYMLGFLPGFAYLGKVDDMIAMPRLEKPRQKVAAGSVGIAGKQTGIYPLDSPGGWQIIGRTPLKLFNASLKPRPTGSSGGASPASPSASIWRPRAERAFENSLSLLQPGDEVQFYSVTKDEYESYQSRHS